MNSLPACRSPSTDSIRMIFNRTESQDGVPEDSTDDPLTRFRSWRGFFFATVAVNLLFVYGMLSGMGNANLSIWYKTLIWLPFNVIATALYLAIMTRLGNSGWGIFRILCIVMVVANWSVLLSV